MLPSLGPRVTISANTGGSLRHGASTTRPSDGSRHRRGRPPLAPSCCAATLAQPTRKSLDGIKSLESSALRPEQLIEDIQTLPVASSTAEVSGIPHSVSAASLSSESDLVLLLGVGDASQAGSTPLVFGSFPPVAVSLPSADSADATARPSSTEPEADVLASTVADDAPDALSAEASSKASKLNAASHEFYPQAYLAAATALAATTLRSAARAHAGSTTPAATAADPAAQQTTYESAAAAAAPEQESQADETSVPAAAAAAAEEVAPAAQAVYAAAAAQQAPQAEPPAHHQQQQQYWAVQQYTPEAQQQQQQWQQPLTEQQWMEQQQQWQHWQQQQAHHQMMPMSVLVPIYVQPYPYSHYVQQHPQMHMVPVMMPADASAAAVAAPSYYQAPQAPHQQQQQPQQQLQVCPPSPSGYSLPADTCSLMSATTPAATPTGWQHNTPYGSSRPGSSAGSMISNYSSSTSRRQRQHFGDAAAREAGTVTVSAMSCVKDAAGALAKVVTRHGSGMLLSLVKPGESVAQATHVAAKSLAVARFYVNAHMAAAGAAGIDAAAALTGVEHSTQSVAAADAAGPAAAAATAAAAAAAAVDDEVVFMPYHRSSSSRQAVDAADVALGFMVAKASAKDLPVLLPPPVGIPACMQDKVQQQGQQRTAAAAVNSSSAASAGSTSSSTLLKAGANTDVNKLSNAVIHNILGSGHVAMQLAGAAACHVAMRSLVKARDRLMRKFNTDIVATASFANEDTSSSIGRSTVFLRLDVMRSNLLNRVAAAGSAVVQAVEGQQQQQQQLAVASA